MMVVRSVVLGIDSFGSNGYWKLMESKGSVYSKVKNKKQKISFTKNSRLWKKKKNGFVCKELKTESSSLIRWNVRKNLKMVKTKKEKLWVWEIV